MFIANFSLKSLAGQLFLDNFFTSLIGNISLYFPFLLPSFFIFKRSNLFRLNYWPSQNYPFFIILSLLFFIFGTAFFSAGISEPLRIHERYYSFLFVPFLIVYLYFFSLYTFNSKEKLKFFLSFIFGILIVKFLLLRHYDINYIDNPDLFFIYSVNKYILFVLFITMFGFLLKKSIKFTNLSFLILVIISTLTMSKCYLARKLDTPWDLAGKKVCSEKLDIHNVYVENVVGFGFFYYQCPGRYNVFYFDNFNFEFKDRSIYIGNFVAENQENFSKLTKISDSIFYKR
jgi:hypothetical protein